MATRAFLLCGDEKAVQAVTQILDELEVSFEHSSEPAFSLKRLATQRFELLIVDCDNVQNATQVFNSARASNLNKTSIAIAIVEGKAGVPHAFRLGASLVLTKPVSLEQVRNTLRTGIGMSRKDTPEAKASAATPAVPTQAVAAPPSVVPPAAVGAASPAGFTPIVPTPAATPAPVRPPVAPTVLTPVAPAATVSTPVVSAPKAALPPAPPAEKPSPAPRAVSTPVAPDSEQKTVPTSSVPTKAVPTVGPSALAKAASASAPASAPVKNFDSVFATPVLAEKSEKIAAPKVTETKTTANEKKQSVTPTLSIVDPLAEEDALDPVRDQGVPSFGGMGSQSFAGLETSEPKRGRGALIAAGVLLLLAAAGYGAWLTQPGFRKAISGQYLNTMTKIGLQHAQAEATEAAKPVTSTAPIAAAPAPNSATNPDNGSGDPNATPAANSSAATAATAAPNPTATNSATPTETALAENSKAGTVQGAKQDTTHPSASPALVPASANLPSTAAPKTASSDLLEIPEDFADDQVVHRVHPTYPKQARARKIHGTVVLQAIVNKQGKVDSLQLVSGDALLAQAAADAVKQWRYKPYSHNGEPADFQTRVTVDFKLP